MFVWNKNVHSDVAYREHCQHRSSLHGFMCQSQDLVRFNLLIVEGNYEVCDAEQN